ncbi:helix-turn-helix domain-containing protein [Streptomyces graminilatus]|uniref:helix-turn-helix domain-containing protein n=1 Tax=Streptomyces graminilatus TaxID=1464070 RepID=UPI0006E1BAD1|nr:helix-turn-helix domain-containing protein [Streptomyces graminilatus]
MKRRYTYPEAAHELRVEESWLRRHIKRLPHAKKGRVVTFSEDDLDRIDTLHHHEPSAGPFAQESVPSAGASLHPMSHLRPLPSRGARVRTG